jgi:hypothetical protein
MSQETARRLNAHPARPIIALALMTISFGARQTLEPMGICVVTNAFGVQQAEAEMVS